MVKAVYKFPSGSLMSVELLTFVTFMLLIRDFKTVTCAAVSSRGFTGLDKLHHSYNPESKMSALDDTVQGDETTDNPSSPTTMSVGSENLFVSQKQHPVPNIDRVTANRNEESTSAFSHSDFRRTLPYFWDKISALSHRVTHQLGQSAVSDQRSVKEEVTSAGTPVTKRKTQAEEKHSKFESRSQTVPRKALKVPPAHPEKSELSSSFQNEKWPFSNSENISFSNSSSFTNGTEMYERWDIPVLNEKENNELSGTLLSSNRLISNITSNKSSFVDYGSHQAQVNELSNGKSDVGRLIKVINSSDSTQSERSPQGEHSPNSNVGSEMNDGIITSVNANDLGINTTANSNNHGAIMSLDLAASETDEKLDALSSSVNKKVAGRERPNSFAEKVNEMHLDFDNSGSITKEIFGVVNSTQLVELNDSALYSEDQRSDSENQSTKFAENGVDETGGVVKSGSDVTVLNVDAGDSIECELAGGERNGSWVETCGGYSDGNARGVEVRKGIDLVPTSSIDSNVVSSNSPSDLVNNGTLNVRVPESGTVSSERNGGHNVTDNVGFKQDNRPGVPSVVKHESVKSSRIPGKKHGILRVLRTRDVEITRIYSDSVSELALEHDRNISGLAKSLISNETKYRNNQQRYFANNSSTKDVENLSVGTSFLHPHTVDSSDTLQSSGNNVTLGPHSASAGVTNGASVTYIEHKELDLTDNAFPEVSALTSKLFTNRVNEEGTEYLQDRSENLTFIADVFSTSAEIQNYTTNHDMQQNATIRVSDRTALQVTEYYNSSNVSYEVVPIHEISDVTAEFNFEVNVTSNSYNVSFPTSDFHDKDEGIWSSLTPVLSTPESPVGGSVSNVTTTSVPDVSSVSLGNGSASDGEPGWPVKLSAEVAGDVILGGLMMVHERQDNTTCGPIMPQGGIQALETMLYTLDVLNRDPKMIPNVTIGAHILDDCDKDTYGLEMAVDFIKGREIDCNSMILL
jgi:hypothetical protein